MEDQFTFYNIIYSFSNSLLSRVAYLKRQYFEKSYKQIYFDYFHKQKIKSVFRGQFFSFSQSFVYIYSIKKTLQHTNNLVYASVLPSIAIIPLQFLKMLRYLEINQIKLKMMFRSQSITVPLFGATQYLRFYLLQTKKIEKHLVNFGVTILQNPIYLFTVKCQTNELPVFQNLQIIAKQLKFKSFFVSFEVTIVRFLLQNFIYDKIFN